MNTNFLFFFSNVSTNCIIPVSKLVIPRIQSEVEGRGIFGLYYKRLLQPVLLVITCIIIFRTDPSFRRDDKQPELLIAVILKFVE